MSTSEYDAYRPPETGRKRRRREEGGLRSATAGGIARARSSWLTRESGGNREVPVVPDAEVQPYDSYYGRPVVKPVPWKHEISAYLFLGGVAAGSGMLGAGGHALGLDQLRRNGRLLSMTAVGMSGIALVADLGRPERFLNMLRTIKLTSPMSVGTWIFTGYSGFAAIATGAELDRMLGGRSGRRGLPLLGGLLRHLEPVGSGGAWLLAPPLAAYTAVLLSDTATPVWIESRRQLPFVFVSSAAMASGGLNAALTSTAHSAPARRLAVLGAVGDYVAVERLERHLAEVGVAEPLHQGHPGTMMRAAKALVVTGGVLSLLGGRSRAAAVAGGLALATASGLTRFAVVEAGIESAKDPKYTIEPQRRRLAERRAAGQVADAITT